MDTMLEAFSPDDVRRIADVKRVQERVHGDPRFRERIAGAPDTLDAAFRDLGVAITPREIAPLLGEAVPHARASFARDDVGAWPLVQLWMRGKVASQQAIAAAMSTGRFPIAHAGAAAWRRRQLNRLRSEVGPFRDYDTTSPFFGFELSKGCSVGCWFCGVSADAFGGYAAYTGERRRLWREMLAANLELFGAGSGNAILYYATDPFDNPDYDRFLDDFREMTGALPQTTTALPFRRPELTRSVMAMRERYPQLPDRFSVLSAGVLEKIHRSFSPYELRYTELVLMNSGALRPKSDAGRARQHPERLRRDNRAILALHDQTRDVYPETIGCVAGFLVNMVDQTVRLTTPCNTSPSNPDGMRVTARRTFRDAQEYRAALFDIAGLEMEGAHDDDRSLRFRGDLSYEPVEDGFVVTSKFMRHIVKGQPWHRSFGDLLIAGAMNRRALEIELSGSGVPLTVVSAAVDRLIDEGVLV